MARVTAAQFIEAQEKYFQEALGFWRGLAAKGIPDCDFVNDEEGNGQMEWTRQEVTLTLSGQLQWNIEVSGDTVGVFNPVEEDDWCLEMLKKLLLQDTQTRQSMRKKAFVASRPITRL